LKTIFYIFLLSMSLLSEDAIKDQVETKSNNGDKKGTLDLSAIMKQIDSSLSKKNVKMSSDWDAEADRLKREKNYKKFNEAAKKYHLHRATKFKKILSSLIDKTKEKLTISIYEVEYYGSVGKKEFAYVKKDILLNAKFLLLEASNTLKKLENLDNLLDIIAQFDLKTISKILAATEQTIMAVNGLGKRSVRKTNKVQDTIGSDALVKLEVGKTVGDIEILSCDLKEVKIRIKV
jgi:hypothetical protein